MDGIVGLGRLQNVADNAEGVKAPTLVDALVAQNVITAKVIGIHLSGGTDALNDGEITFGAADASVIDGDLSYVPAIKNDDGFWEVPVAGASVGGKPAAIQQGVTAILDSGTSFMLLPPADADAINLQIPGAVANGETYAVPCGSSALVTLTHRRAAVGHRPQELRRRAERERVREQHRVASDVWRHAVAAGRDVPEKRVHGVRQRRRPCRVREPEE